MDHLGNANKPFLGIVFTALLASCGSKSTSDAGTSNPDALASDATMDVGAREDAGTLDARQDAAGVGDSGTNAVGSFDPAPNFNTPGEYGCAGCPDTDTTTFELASASLTRDFAGIVQDAGSNGEFYVVSSGGLQLAGAIPTTTVTGSYDFTAPLFCGEQLIKCVWSNAQGRYVLVVRVITSNCVEPDIRATLLWDAIGRDFELHLIKPGGRINDNATDCTWTSCIGSSPDWGVAGDPSDNPKKDVDNTGAFGPENIFLAKPENGTFTVMVEHWGSGGPDADGRVILNVKGLTYIANIQNLASHRVWTVGEIDWPTGVVRTSTAIYDCSGNWSGGCRADIP